ncbi:putative ribonuclease P [Microsporum canis]
MFDFEDPLMDQEKCFISVGKLPVFIDPTQPPQKKAPFSAILGHAFNHKVELILPREVHESAWSSISEAVQQHRYARAIFPLSALLEGEFFTKYIKIGNVLMISEGRRGVDNVYALKDG